MGSGSGNLDPNVTGLDPTKYAEMVKAIEKDGPDLGKLTQHFRARFAALGLTDYGLPRTGPIPAPARVGGPDPLGQLTAVSRWIDDQLPDLRRRRRLAEVLEKQRLHIKPTNVVEAQPTFVYVDERKVGKGAHSTRDGKRLGKKVSKALDDGDDVPTKLLDDLHEHSDDADFINAFYDALGAKGLATLSRRLAKADKNDREYNRGLLADTFGTYTRGKFDGMAKGERQKAWRTWLDSFDPNGILCQPQDLTPLLKGGSFGTDFLVALGDQIFDEKAARQRAGLPDSMERDPLGHGVWSADHYTQFLDAIKDDPDASAQWFDHNYERMNKIIHGADPQFKVDGPPGRSKAFHAAMTAAVMDSRRTDPKLAIKLASRLALDNYKYRATHTDGKGHSLGGVDTQTSRLYRDIIVAYWDTFQDNITSPASNGLWMGKKTGTAGERKWDYRDFLSRQDPDVRGPQMGPMFWQSLLTTAIQDPGSAAVLGGMYQSFERKSKEYSQSLRIFDDKGKAIITREAFKYYATEQNIMRKTFRDSFAEAEQEAGANVSSWVKRTNEKRYSILSEPLGMILGAATGGAPGLVSTLAHRGLRGFSTSAALGRGLDAGREAVKDAAKDKLLDDSESLVTDWVKKQVQVGKDDAPEDLKRSLRDVPRNAPDTSQLRGYQEDARGALVNARGKGKIKNIVVKEPDGRERPYSGDPSFYFHGPAGNFLGKDGMPLSPEHMTPKQLAAYARWLRSPAVVIRGDSLGFN